MRMGATVYYSVCLGENNLFQIHNVSREEKIIAKNVIKDSNLKVKRKRRFRTIIK